jgi:hypothetical protein
VSQVSALQLQRQRIVGTATTALWLTDAQSAKSLCKLLPAFLISHTASIHFIIHCRARVHAVRGDCEDRTLCRGQKDAPICKEAARLQPLCCGNPSPAQESPEPKGAATTNFRLSVEIYRARVTRPQDSFLPRNGSAVSISSIGILAGIVVGGTVGVVCGKIVLFARRNHVHHV